MAQVDVIRPASVRKAGAGAAVPSGNLASVTNDNSDSTYIDFNLADFGNNWSLRCGSHTPPADHQRHRIRGRIRIRTDAGTCTEDIDVGRGTTDFVVFKTVDVTASFSEQVTDWYSTVGLGLEVSGALTDLNVGGGWMRSSTGAAEIRTAECYLDIDCREQPSYAPEVRDAAGVDQSGGTVTDTTQPTMFFGGVDYDDLPALDWSTSVHTGSDTGPEVWSASGSGIPPTQVEMDVSLADGTYFAVWSVRSTIREIDPFENYVSVTFDVGNIVPPPSPPLVSVTSEFGGYRVNWANPGGQEWDDDYVVTEVWRDDCTGSQRIATVPDSLNGSYLDLAIPQLDPQPSGVDCAVSSEACDITYRVRYWGYISTFVELPDSLPDDLILGWPSTAASIPSGWSRVTSLDGFYPRGTNLTSAPSATGGATSHSHTTPGHTHQIAAHSHSLGGSTGSSNSSTTSARFNGASQPQADQPHTHTRPSSTGTQAAHTSGSENPGTSSASNAPPTLEVIWIQSDGAQVAYPAGIVGWATEAVSGWDTYTTANGRYLKGAAAAGNGGATSGSSTHTHSVSSHLHTGFHHDHTIGSTGLSNPSSSQEAGDGSSTPRWLPRHTHPMDVISTTSGDTNSVGGGTTGSGTSEPPNRRLRVIRNSGGGIQTRVIGLYTGTVAALDPLLTLCDGTSGTPDMRTWFARDAGSDSINSTGGSSSHTHSTPNHTHDLGNHSHDTTVETSSSTSYEAPSFGDLGDSPTTGHTHSSGNTANASPGVSSSTSGTTNSVSHIPSYKEVHFVRLDGTISGGPLPVPELKTTEFSSATVPSMTYTDELDRLSSFTVRLPVTTDRSSNYRKVIVDSTPLDGGLHTVSSTIAGEELTLSIAVESMPAIDAVEDLLTSDRLYWSPLGGTPGWFAPASWTVQRAAPGVWVIQVPMTRQDWPATPEPQEYL